MSPSALASVTWICQHTTSTLPNWPGRDPRAFSWSKSCTRKKPYTCLLDFTELQVWVGDVRTSGTADPESLALRFPEWFPKPQPPLPCSLLPVCWFFLKLPVFLIPSSRSTLFFFFFFFLLLLLLFTSELSCCHTGNWGLFLPVDHHKEEPLYEGRQLNPYLKVELK